MGISVEEVGRACADLKLARSSVLEPMPRSDVVAAVSEWALRWKAPSSLWRRAAERLTDPFPFAMTRVSLEALLDSLTPDALWELIDAEDVRDVQGVPLVGHVIAGNTPLLAWVSVLRALLMRSASFVKLPAGGAGEWGRLFVQSLAETAPMLAACVHLAQWPGGTTVLEAVLCDRVDLLLAYGSPSTISGLQILCPSSTGFVGYGHRVSFGLVPADASFDTAAEGFARDVLLYDQGGCLSPHTIFVQAPRHARLRFAEGLADALREAVARYPQIERAPHAAARVQEARLLARMESGTVSWEDRNLRWTVVAREDRSFAVSPAHGVVSVQPLSDLQALAVAVTPCAGHLQGCAVALTENGRGGEGWAKELANLGVSRICRPGELQKPPFSWREDGRDVLRSLMPPPDVFSL